MYLQLASVNFAYSMTKLLPLMTASQIFSEAHLNEDVFLYANCYLYHAPLFILYSYDEFHSI